MRHFYTLQVRFVRTELLDRKPRFRCCDYLSYQHQLLVNLLLPQILVIGKSDVAAQIFPRIQMAHLDSFPQLRGNDVVLRLHI